MNYLLVLGLYAVCVLLSLFLGLFYVSHRKDTSAEEDSFIVVFSAIPVLNIISSMVLFVLLVKLKLDKNREMKVDSVSKKTIV